MLIRMYICDYYNYVSFLIFFAFYALLFIILIIQYMCAYKKNLIWICLCICAFIKHSIHVCFLHSTNVRHIHILGQCANRYSGAETLNKNLFCKFPTAFLCVKLLYNCTFSYIASENSKFSLQKRSVQFRVQTTIASNIRVFIIATCFIHIHHFRFLVRWFVYRLFRDIL